jgi:ribonuclease P protein component
VFPKKNRITKKVFDELMKNGRVFHSLGFSFRFMKKEGTVPRFSFVVSKKVAKNAVDRNVAKRKGYHALRELVFPLKIHEMNGLVGAFFFKKEGKNMGFEGIKREIRELLVKSGAMES